MEENVNMIKNDIQEIKDSITRLTNIIEVNLTK